MSDKQKLVFIFGPTGVGKTDLAVSVARGIGEIISVDSMQVYRGLDLGTAKPDAEALQAVPHHLVSIVSPDYRFSAGDFRRMALSEIGKIRNRGRIPILVGGTGLYFRALEYDLAQAPKADVELREELYRREEQRRGWLYEQLMANDPETARHLHPRDLVRIVRALEIYELSGKRFSQYRDENPEPQFETKKIGLIIERELLYKRLERRCREMTQRGLAGEVYSLLQRGYDERYPSMKGLGYSHFIQYFKGCYAYSEVLRLFVRDTKRYAKRQLTWFRKEKGVSWYSPEHREKIRTHIREFAGV